MLKELTEFDLKRGKPQAQCKKCRAEYMATLYKNNREVEKQKRKIWYEKNKSKVSLKGKADRQANPDKHKFQRRLKKYGITREQYSQKLEENSHKCEICKSPFTDTPAIDHDHDTLAFRSLLCDNCNTALGLLQDSPEVVKSSETYLRKYKK